MTDQEFLAAIAAVCAEYAPAAQAPPDYAIVIKYQDADGLHLEVFDNQEQLENTLCLLEDAEDFVSEAIEAGLADQHDAPPSDEEPTRQ